MYAGLDIGSLSTEAVLVSDSRILAHSILITGAHGTQVARRALDEALELAGARFEDVKGIVATGYGRVVVPFAQKNISELSCHAKGACHFFPGRAP